MTLVIVLLKLCAVCSWFGLGSSVPLFNGAREYNVLSSSAINVSSIQIFYTSVNLNYAESETIKLFDQQYQSCILSERSETEKRNGFWIHVAVPELINVAYWEVFFGSGTVERPRSAGDCFMEGIPDASRMYGDAILELNSAFFNSTRFSSSVPTLLTQTRDVTYMKFYVGSGGVPVSAWAYNDWAVCELNIYAYDYTLAPTTQPSFLPTAQPTVPTVMPSGAPSAMPTVLPTMMPTLQPTIDECPNRYARQNCCSTDPDSFLFETFTYSVIDNRLLESAANITEYCGLSLVDVDCCGNQSVSLGSSFKPADSSTQFECLENGTELARGSAQVCDFSFMTEYAQSPFSDYAYTGEGTLNQYDIGAALCTCDYAINRCKNVSEPVCKQSIEVCTPLASGMHVISSNLNFDANASTCGCAYELDVDECVVSSHLNDSDACTIDYLEHCVFDYHNGLNNTDALCVHPFPNATNARTQLYLSYWLNNSTMESICQCRFSFYNCSTAFPSAEPSVVPSLYPSAQPTPSPTNYRHQDYTYRNVSRICDSGASGNACNMTVVSEHALVWMTETNASCMCLYRVGHWDWLNSIYALTVPLPNTVWKTILPNVSWQFGVLYSEYMTNDECLQVVVDECDASSDQCPNRTTSTVLLNNDLSYDLFDIGRTYERIESDHFCYCYFMFVSGSCAPTSDPSMEPSVPSSVPTLAPSKRPTLKPTKLQIKAKVSEAERFYSQNKLFVIIGACFLGPIVLAFLCVIVIKCKKAKKKREKKKLKKAKAEETQAQEQAQQQRQGQTDHYEEQDIEMIQDNDNNNGTQNDKKQKKKKKKKRKKKKKNSGSKKKKKKQKKYQT